MSKSDANRDRLAARIAKVRLQRDCYRALFYELYEKHENTHLDTIRAKINAGFSAVERKAKKERKHANLREAYFKMHEEYRKRGADLSDDVAAGQLGTSRDTLSRALGKRKD